MTVFTGSTDHSDDHPDPDGPEDGKEELPGEESRGGGDFGLDQRHLLGQDGHPHPEQDDGGALVAQWKHGGAGKRIYASNFDKKTPGQEDLSKVACFCSNAEFKPEDLVKPVVGRELIWDEPVLSHQCQVCLMQQRWLGDPTF